MKVPFLDLHAQYESIRPDIDAAISTVIANTAFIQGDGVRTFESEFAEYVGTEQCVGVGNGTDALEIGLEALNLPPGSEVIVPANSFIGSSESVTRTGHQVVFADVDSTYTLDPIDVEKRITGNTAAIMPVHLYGHRRI